MPDGGLVFANRSRVAADLVVAADGTGSRLRDGLGLITKRKALADGAIRLLLPKMADEAPDDGTTIEYWSGSRRILHTPCSRSEVYVALTMLDCDAVTKVTPILKAAWKAWFLHD